MPYTDFQSAPAPISAREASTLTRIALLLVFLLFPVLLFAQQSRLPASIAALDAIPAISGVSARGELPRTTGDNTSDTRRSSSSASGAKSAASAAPPAARSTVDLNAAAPAFGRADLGTVLPFPERHDRANSTAENTADLRTFSGARISDVIQLHWNTVSEDGLAGFEIERRTQRENSWQSIGFLRPGRRASGSYSFLDRLCGSGVMYYRIRQVRTDGSTAISPVVSVVPDDILQSFDIWRHSLQPFQRYGSASFGLARPSPVTLTLTDRYGSTLTTIIDGRTMDAGHHVIPFGTTHLAPGLYFLRIRTDAQIRTLIFLHS